jgi:hypothetical protein
LKQQESDNDRKMTAEHHADMVQISFQDSSKHHQTSFRHHSVVLWKTKLEQSIKMTAGHHANIVRTSFKYHSDTIQTSTKSHYQTETMARVSK